MNAAVFYVADNGTLNANNMNNVSWTTPGVRQFPFNLNIWLRLNIKELGNKINPKLKSLKI